MARFFESTEGNGSMSVLDFCCSQCFEQKIDQEADFYCDNCLKLFCAKCINLHVQMFREHVTFGRRDIRKWPVAKEVEEFLQQCDLHEGKRLKHFCNDHSKLCCSNCEFCYHRQCAKVTLISKAVKEHQPDLKLLSKEIQSILETLNILENNWNTNMLTLQASYDKQLHEIHVTRQKINTILDKIEISTMQELEDKFTSLKASVQNDADNCSKLKNELKRLSGAIDGIVDKEKEELAFIASTKCLEKVKQFETYLKENFVQVERSLTFQAENDIQTVLSNLSGLGKIVLNTQALTVLSDKVFTVQGRSEYGVRIPSDDKRRRSFISAICVLSNDQIIVADFNNKRVKLLNHHYQVVGHCDLTASPEDMCKITSSEVAIAVDKKKTHEVLFVSVNGVRLVKDRKLTFQHRCYGIAFNQKYNQLYLTTGTALYNYSISGVLLKKLYEDISGDYTVSRCAVSPLGDKIFVLNIRQGQVLTLAKDGTPLYTFTDTDLHNTRGIHVTPQGQVLVCGGVSKTMLQLDGGCTKKLATLATKDDLNFPVSVFYNRSTTSIIVGQLDSNTLSTKILVFKVT